MAPHADFPIYPSLYSGIIEECMKERERERDKRRKMERSTRVTG
jgi:hypothetical protein